MFFTIKNASSSSSVVIILETRIFSGSSLLSDISISWFGSISTSLFSSAVLILSRYFLSNVYCGQKNSSVIEKFKPLVKTALNQFVTEMMIHSFGSVCCSLH